LLLFFKKEGFVLSVIFLKKRTKKLLRVPRRTGRRAPGRQKHGGVARGEGHAALHKTAQCGGGDCIAAVCYNQYGHGLLENNSQEVVTARREINSL